MNLGSQLGAAAMLVVVMALVHGLGVVGITKLLRLEDEALRAHRLDVVAFSLLMLMTFCLFALHFFEIFLFALFYLAVGAIDRLEPALYFSAAAYTTLGPPGPGFVAEWRLVGAFEGLIGFLLIGWSTAVFVTDMNKLLRAEVGTKDADDS